MVWTLIYLLVFVPLVTSVALYEQCGGEGYNGPTQCVSPLRCFQRSRWFSSCQITCPGGDWQCAKSDGYFGENQIGTLAAGWSQCGGEGWTGPTECVEYFCQTRSKWYSQCRPDCPVGWICSGVEEASVEVLTGDLEELELYNPDDFVDNEGDETDEFDDPSIVDLDELQKQEEALVGGIDHENPFGDEEEESRRKRYAVRATSCKANGKSGTCISTSSCKGTSVPGHCPGAVNIQCCVSSDAGGSSGGNRGGSCGGYAGAKTASIKGNGNKAYSVVKIKKIHLANPGSYSLAPTQSDNTITTSTACAFDKMATAAKNAGVTISIASGFRTIARQQYFWNCYVSKRCNGGNLAARPGTSNHGRGIALDLNTNCGKQAGVRPNCGRSRVYQWLYKNAHKYGFTRTVKSEPWHWEFRGVGVGRASFS